MRDYPNKSLFTIWIPPDEELAYEETAAADS
jgi:hypothetical protein